MRLRRRPAFLGGPQALAAEQGERVRVHGAVADLVPWYAAADVVVCPLLAGSGTSIKVLEALAMGRVVVTTTMGGRGLGLMPGTEILTADDPEEHADAIRRVLAEPTLAAAMAQAGRRAVAARFAASMADAAIASLLATVVATPVADDGATMDDKPVQVEGLEITEVEDGLVVYDPVKRRVHHLNATAVLIFELSNGTNSIGDIVEVVQRVFALSAPPRAEVDEAVAQLRSEGLIA